MIGKHLSGREFLSFLGAALCQLRLNFFPRIPIYGKSRLGNRRVMGTYNGREPISFIFYSL